jgi:hypothetical protein
MGVERRQRRRPDQRQTSPSTGDRQGDGAMHNFGTLLLKSGAVALYII